MTLLVLLLSLGPTRPSCYEVRDPDMRAYCKGACYEIRDPDLRAMCRADRRDNR